MDEWAWEQLEPWSAVRLGLPVGPLFCVINGPTRGRPWSAAAARGAAPDGGRRGRAAPVRAASAPSPPSLRAPQAERVEAIHR